MRRQPLVQACASIVVIALVGEGLWIVHLSPAAVVPPSDRGAAALAAQPPAASVAQIRHAYGLDLTALDGSGQVIAVITAFHDASLAGDLNRFNRVMNVPPIYGLPALSSCDLKQGPHPCLVQLALGAAGSSVSI